MTDKNFPLYIGETWTFDGIANKPDWTPLDLTGGSVELRFVQAGALVMKATAVPDITIAAGTGGTWTFSLPPSDPRQASFAEGDCTYEVDAVSADGHVTVQNAGTIALKNSLRKQFP